MAVLNVTSPLRAKPSGRRFNIPGFLGASAIAAAVLVSLVAIPQWLSSQARWEQLRSQVGDIARLAASVVDGDLHRQLLQPKNYTKELYDRAVAPLVRLHNASPDIFYVYTMVDRGGVAYFVLDTAASPDLHAKHELRASAYMEKYELDEDNGEWLREIASGKTYINPDFEEDDYGNFLSALAPVYDSEGNYAGFVGVDFDLQYYLSREARFRAIVVTTLGAALLLSLIIGYLVAAYHGTVSQRIEELYDSSIHDSLTGLLNRRGAMHVIKKSLEEQTGTCAVLLVDVDNLKIINDMRGHATGDAVLARTSETIIQSVREDDLCARLGDEFLVFASDCDGERAMEIAKNILVKLSGGMPLAGAAFSISIGIAVHDGPGADFADMNRNADEALYQAKAEGRNRIGVFAPSTSAPFAGSRPKELTA